MTPREDDAVPAIFFQMARLSGKWRDFLETGAAWAKILKREPLEYLGEHDTLAKFSRITHLSQTIASATVDATP